MTFTVSRIVSVAVLFASLATGTDFYAAPNGSSAGTGAIGSPWDLQTALNQPVSVHPGDTIWLRGGTYRANNASGFSSQINGTPTSPITVRNYAGEPVTIDGSGLAYGLAVYGSNTAYWGIQVSGTQSSNGDAVAVFGAGIKCNNLIVNGAAAGFTSYGPAAGNGMIAVAFNSLAANLSGTVSVTASASATANLAGVQFQVDGVNLGSATTQFPYAVTWDTTTSSNASHTVTATATDILGNQATASVPVTVTNAVAAPANAQFVALDARTQGNWKSKYGTDGYTVVDDSAVSPGYARVTPSMEANYLWTSSTTDVRALQKGATNDRIAATWYASSVFYVDVNITDRALHQIAVYCLDWDSLGRAQTVDVLDATNNAVLDTRAIPALSGGVYLIWNISGHVKLRFTQTSANFNAVVSGIFFEAAPLPAASAAFVTLDTTTQGNWKSKYGADGYSIVDNSAKSPSYGAITPSLANDYVWSSSTSDGRALQKGSANDRIASAWYASSFFYVDLNFTDHLSHQVAVYCIDWDALGRAQTVDTLDAATGAVLDSHSISGFNNGVYLVWNISGHVKLRFTQTSANFNAVASGIFAGARLGPSAVFVAADTAIRKPGMTLAATRSSTIRPLAPIN